MDINSKLFSPAGADDTHVLWGPAWVDGVLGRLTLMQDGSTLAERLGPDGWWPDEFPSVEELLTSGVPATAGQLQDLGLQGSPSSPAAVISETT